MDIKKYKKDKLKERTVNARIYEKQYKFIKENNINFSKFSRDMLNKLMEKEK